MQADSAWPMMRTVRLVWVDVQFAHLLTRLASIMGLPFDPLHLLTVGHLALRLLTLSFWPTYLPLTFTSTFPLTLSLLLLLHHHHHHLLLLLLRHRFTSFTHLCFLRAPSFLCSGPSLLPSSRLLVLAPQARPVTAGPALVLAAEPHVALSLAAFFECPPADVTVVEGHFLLREFFGWLWIVASCGNSVQRREGVDILCCIVLYCVSPCLLTLLWLELFFGICLELHEGMGN
jgi:hypothetical protein